MIARKPPICPHCGGAIKAVHRKAPANFVGDTFSYWDWDGHKCQIKEEVPSPPEYSLGPWEVVDGRSEEDIINQTVDSWQKYLESLKRKHPHDQSFTRDEVKRLMGIVQESAQHEIDQLKDTNSKLHKMGLAAEQRAQELMIQLEKSVRPADNDELEKLLRGQMTLQIAEQKHEYERQAWVKANERLRKNYLALEKNYNEQMERGKNLQFEIDRLNEKLRQYE